MAIAKVIWCFQIHMAVAKAIKSIAKASWLLLNSYTGTKAIWPLQKPYNLCKSFGYFKIHMAVAKAILPFQKQFGLCKSYIAIAKAFWLFLISYAVAKAIWSLQKPCGHCKSLLTAFKFICCHNSYMAVAKAITIEKVIWLF